VVYTYNSSTWEAEAGGLREFKAILGYIAILCLKNQNKTYKQTTGRSNSIRITHT
jgi:hypothetical protein